MAEYICWGAAILFVVICGIVAWCCCAMAGSYDDLSEHPDESLKVPAITYPRDWWEAVKERFLPRWAKRLWPITYNYVVWDATVLYPLISLPEEAHYLSEVRADIREGTDT